jgi:hypothetical protein
MLHKEPPYNSSTILVYIHTLLKLGYVSCLLKICCCVTATGVFTPDSIRRDATALWKQIPEPVQVAYTKEYFDDLVNNMINYSTLGVSLELLVKSFGLKKIPCDRI